MFLRSMVTKEKGVFTEKVFKKGKNKRRKPALKLCRSVLDHSRATKCGKMRDIYLKRSLFEMNLSLYATAA